MAERDRAERTFAQHRAGEDRGLPYCEAGSGAVVVVIVGSQGFPTRAHALLAEDRRVLVFALPADAGTPQQTARRIGAAVAALGIARFDVMGEGAGAAPALWLALASQAEIGGEIGAVALAAPEGPPDDAFRAITQPVLVLCGTKDPSGAGDRTRMLLPDCHFMFVYDAGPAIGAERPEALAFIVREFFERRALFLVSRESGMAFP